MKKGILIGFVFLAFMMSFGFVSSLGCNLQVSMVNQDPYPAIPGEEAKLLFQIDGVQNPECGKVELELVENYPISLMPGQKQSYVVNSGTYQRNYESFFMAPYSIFLNGEALDGENTIEVRYRFGSNSGWATKQFNLEVEDVRADFEVFVEDYDVTTKTLTFEILNTAESDIEALTIEIPKQENIEIKGSKINIVGDLDSNDYTSADFEAIVRGGEINLNIIYSDKTNERRMIQKTVLFEPEYFEGMVRDQEESQNGKYVVYAILILLVVWYFYRRHKKKSMAKKLKNRR